MSISTLAGKPAPREMLIDPVRLEREERLRDNRRMTDAAHNQHSESRRPSDRDRIVTTGPSRFQPARPEVLR
jgi:hypothetical protein